jgi:cephalosporin hydroxylase
LVDPWHAYSNNPQGKSKEKHEFSYNETLRKTAGYPNVRIVKGYSNDAVRDVPLHSLDFCYIDGQHQFNFVMADLIEWSERVRSGGIVSGDDYYALDEKRWGAGPVEAVQAYTKAHRIPIWFTCDAPRSVDFFWVKP